MKKFNIHLLAMIFFLNSCSTKIIHLTMKAPVPTIGKTLSSQTLLMGGLSGLIFEKITDENELVFYTITDRGPNAKLTNDQERPFLLPQFTPQILTLKTNLKDHTFEVLDTLNLLNKNEKPLTGLPPARLEENPIDVFGHIESLDPEGIDSEGLVADGEKGFWVAEEYLPSLLHFNHLGKMTKRLSPLAGLPKSYAERKTNRGFEAVVKDQNKIFGFLQSPLKTDQDFSRIIEVNLDTLKTTNEYFYPFEKGLDKIGDAVSLSHNQFLVIEQNGKKGKESRKYIYKITLNGGDQLVKKELLLDLYQTPFKFLEKIEGLALIDNRRIAIINDNDFNIDGPVNFSTGLTPLNQDPNEMLIIEFNKDIR